VLREIIERKEIVRTQDGITAEVQKFGVWGRIHQRSHEHRRKRIAPEQVGRKKTHPYDQDRLLPDGPYAMQAYPFRFIWVYQGVRRV